MSDDYAYVIWSIEHGRWWAPNSLGYVASLRGAGRYTRAEAERIVRSANVNAFHECLIPVTALEPAPELLDALKFLGHPHDGELCFCQVAIGNPMQTEHSRVCMNARAAIAKAEVR
jgi:hypothetical protein